MNPKHVIVLLLFALAVRLAAAAWWQQRLGDDARFGFPDSESYWMLAERIATGGPYEMNPERRVFRTPGYPALLAVLFVAAGEQPPVWAARVMSALLGVAAVAGVMGMAGLLFGGRAAGIAGAATAVYPGAVAMSTFVLSEAPFCPLMMLQLICWTLAWRTENKKRGLMLAVAAGAVAGGATLIRPSWLLFTPFAAVVAIAVSRDRRQALITAAAMMAGLIAVMMPWWVRNWRVTGSFVPTTLQVGESLYDGWNPHATGASEMSFVDQFREQLRAADAAGPPPAQSFEQRLDNAMRDAAIRWAAENPGRVLWLAGVKFARMWNVWPNEPAFRSVTMRMVVLVGYVPLLVLGLWGAKRYARRGWPDVLCVLPAVYFSLLHMVFVGSIRYRQPALLPLIVLAAAVVAEYWHRWRPAADDLRGADRRS